MTTSEWILIGLIASGILLVIGAVYFIIGFLSSKKHLRAISEKKSRSRRKRKKIKVEIEELTKKKNSRFKAFLISLVLGIALIAGSAYFSYYQSMNLSSNDAEMVSKSYFVVRDFEEQLQKLKAGGEDLESTKKNIRYLATTMASYGIQKASSLNTEDGQKVLNRYYNSLSQLGMNATRQVDNLAEDPKLVDEFLIDVEKVKGYEKHAFDYFKVNEDALEAKL